MAKDLFAEMMSQSNQNIAKKKNVTPGKYMVVNKYIKNSGKVNFEAIDYLGNTINFDREDMIKLVRNGKITNAVLGMRKDGVITINMTDKVPIIYI